MQLLSRAQVKKIKPALLHSSTGKAFILFADGSHLSFSNMAQAIVTFDHLERCK